jgi:hypothetical protein
MNGSESSKSLDLALPMVTTGDPRFFGTDTAGRWMMETADHKGISKGL